jgi:hypothetical protein
MVSLLPSPGPYFIPSDAMSDLLRHSNLTVTAWDKERLIGIARAITDFYYEGLIDRSV